MIAKTWNEFPNSVRVNLAKYYLPLVRTKQKISVMDAVAKEYGSGRDIEAGDKRVFFTEEQWTFFILKWA